MRSGIKRLNCYRTFAYKSSSHFLYMNCNTEWAFGASITKKNFEVSFQSPSFVTKSANLWCYENPSEGFILSSHDLINRLPNVPNQRGFLKTRLVLTRIPIPSLMIQSADLFWSPTLRPTYREKGQKKQVRVLDAQDRRKRRMQLIAIKNDRWGKVVTIQCWGTWIQPWLPSLIGCSLLRRFLLDFLYL